MFGIFIPSRSRAIAQKTLYNLSPNLWKVVTLVVPMDQYDIYRKTIKEKDVKILPFMGTGIGPKRDWILKSSHTGKIIMIDDDLQFYKRDSNGTGFHRASPSMTEFMIADIVDYLDRYPMVGLTDKFMSQHKPRQFMECQRFNQVLGFNRDLLPQPWPTFRLQHDEEHDVHLQLLTRGCKTAILTEWSKGDKPGANGGCSDWRNNEVLRQTHEQLQAYWPSIVTITEKEGSANKARYNWMEAKRIGGLVS